MLFRCMSILVVLAAAGAAIADDVVLSSGEVLKVSNVHRHDGRVEMDHPVLGHLNLAEADVTTVHGPDAGTPAPQPAPAAPVAPADAGPQWKYRAELGINGQSGNERSRDLRAAIGALLETPEARWKFEAVYLESKTDGERTKHNWYAQGLHDWLFKDSPWLAFVTARYDRDEFQAWDARLSVGAGVGYRLIDEKDLQVRLRAGLNETREYEGPNDGDWRLEGLLGAEASWQINEAQSLEGSVTYYPDLQESGEYRVVGTAAWSIKLSTDGLSLKLGIEDEYDTHREDPFEKSDLKYFLALLYEF